MNIAYGICSWGIGHATRNIPVIKALLKENHKITIISTDYALKFLKNEFKDQCNYINLEFYPYPFTKTKYVLARIYTKIPAIMKGIVKENIEFKKILRKQNFNLIISDCRYGIFSKEIPSFFVTHQLRYIYPKRSDFMENVLEFYNAFFHDHFRKFIVPDTEKNDLSGELSHQLKFYEKEKVEYVGILTDLEKKQVKEDIDYFVSLSASSDPNKKEIKKRVINQLDKLEGKKIVTLGKPGKKREKKKGDIIFYDYLTRKETEDIMNRSKFIISRAGYTTIMELAALNKKAFLIPLTGQTEQEYLANYHKSKGHFYSVATKDINLVKDIEEVKKYSGIKEKHNPKKSVKNFLDIIFS